MKDEFRFRFGKAKEVAAYSQQLNVIKINRREHKMIDNILWADYNI